MPYCAACDKQTPCPHWPSEAAPTVQTNGPIELDEAIDNAIRGVKLDGATEHGAEATYPSTPGEFAYRWNGWSDERRAAFLAHIAEASSHFEHCPNRADSLRVV